MALATLAELKTELSIGTTAEDTRLTGYLASATAIAEQLARRPLEREVDRIEYPYEPRAADCWPSYVDLALRPIESVAAVKVLTTPGTDAEFTAADALTEVEDYLVDAVMGSLHHVWTTWPASRRMIQVTYTAGYVDPATVAATAAWAADTVYAAGDLVTSGGAVYAALQGHTAATANEPPTGTHWAFVNEAPADLQHGVMQHAVRLWTTRGTGGAREIDLGQGGGTISFTEAKPHPALVAAVEGLPGRWRL